MPIRRQHRWLYPIDWRELSATIRFRRAKGRCEHCGRPHLETVKHRRRRAMVGRGAPHLA